MEAPSLQGSSDSFPLYSAFQSICSKVEGGHSSFSANMWEESDKCPSGSYKSGDVSFLCKGELRDTFFLWCLPVFILALCSPQSELSLCGMMKSTLELSVCLSRASWQVQLSYYTWQQLTSSYSTMASRSFFTDDHKSQTSIDTMNSMNRVHFNYMDNACNR